MPSERLELRIAAEAIPSSTTWSAIRGEALEQHPLTPLLAQ